METKGDKNKPKTSQKQAFNFICVNCDYVTNKKSNFNTHILTSKHINATKGDKMRQKQAKTSQNKPDQSQCENLNFICNCGKQYKCRQSLWRHNKNCCDHITVHTHNDNINNIINNTNNNTNNNHFNHIELEKLYKSDYITDKELIMMLIKDNNDLRKMMVEQQTLVIENSNKVVDLYKNGTHNTTNTHTNSHNKAFNLNFFLNETCKNAMNIMDFAESIQLQLSDLENVGEMGYVEGISNIIVKNLKALDITERPIHCADKKREVIYVKDENKWEKEDVDKKRIRKVINKIACKNQRLLHKFKEAHPGCNMSESKYADQYSKIVIEAMGGSGNNDDEKAVKIIKNIAKEVTIDKNYSYL